MIIKKFSDIDNHKYDVVVIGAGHAGTEAAAASARIGVRTLLITLSLENVGELSCNPSIGGLAKGHLVAEIDALGGLMGKIVDASGIQFRMLNRSKGEAVQGLRVQIDRKAYKKNMLSELDNYQNLDIAIAEVIDINLQEVDNKKFVKSIVIKSVNSDDTTNTTKEIFVRAAVITTGTFGNGLLHFGDKKIVSGRINMHGVAEKKSSGITDFFIRNNVRLLRLKTGTPARIDKNSIDYSQMEIQYSDDEDLFFSVISRNAHSNKNFKKLPQQPCYLTHTKVDLIGVVKSAVDAGFAPMYNGEITGIGPRYCPSIEDKIMRFPHHETHHVFLEPEGIDSDLIYPNGMSTSLPEHIQDAFFKSVIGMENAKIVRYGYAVEYDAIDPTQLFHTLQLHDIEGLFAAGQINGTSGYEEAAAQGILAGINAGLVAQKKPPIEFPRTNSYIGVLINDITTVGVDEPYRMFTSRHEYRLSVRQDNADLRLSPLGISLGIIGTEQKKIFNEKIKLLENARSDIAEKKLDLDLEIAKKSDGKYPFEILQTLIIEKKYSGYLRRQETEIEKHNRDANCRLHHNIDYKKISGLSIEMQEKLSRYKPETLADAQMIPGITPSALTLLLQFATK
ncbi:MAG: tRNA uridine-5-carboxymethylaminomethyl(34) synthesis enzyme MnmG [Rickettsiales bacterium]|jgi:tRNA uridine 5-carboxymethylaminomethyl modification enzyme|nr:tRNA uridine-5-carboxymethylaminomethyl(34) synthesis enzyme MnmG [Rickettsiales bacterium]